MEIKTFRGLSLAEVEAKVRAELGDDAVVLRQREGLSGGVGGFFQRRLWEVDGMAVSGPPAGAEAAAAAAAVAPAPAGAATPMPAPQPAPAADVREDFLSQLKSALGPELEQAAAEQRAAQAAAAFVPAETFAPEPAAPAQPESNGAALAALFAPDVPREPVAWPDELLAVAPAPAPEPVVETPPPVPAPAPANVLLPVPAASALPVHWPAGAGRLQSRLADRGVSDELVAEVLDEA